MNKTPFLLSAALLCCCTLVRAVLSIPIPGHCEAATIEFNEGGRLFGRGTAKLGLKGSCTFIPPEPYDKKMTLEEWAEAEAKKLGLTIKKIYPLVYNIKDSQKEYENRRRPLYNKLVATVQELMQNKNLRRAYVITNKIAHMWRFYWIEEQFASVEDEADNKERLYLFDLDGVDFSNTDLTNADFRSCRLANVNFTNAKLYDTYFSGATFLNIEYHTNLKRAKVKGGDFSRTKGLDQETLNWLKSQGAKIEGAIPAVKQKTITPTPATPTTPEPKAPAALTKAELRAYVLKNKKCPTPNCDLSGINFSSSGPQETDLKQANLAGANLSETNLTGANLTGANLSDTKLRKASLGIVILAGANLSKADLTGASFVSSMPIGAILDQANFTEAILSGADLSGASCNRANFSKALFENTKLKGALLANCLLDGAQYSEGGKKYPVTIEWLEKQGAIAF